LPYKSVKIKTERIFTPPGSPFETPDGFPAEWFYVGPQSWTLNEFEATAMEDLDASLIISGLEKTYPGIKFRFVILQ
jgi:hypothetical protein